ncbi:GNAT family N-acetyltransferase [Limosilactobacillus fastidiosus]|uniref:GNAT family N-acetyltransferase n=1 Tax=Limosilactobacillus fastidiosus TaxID=2759855 RepID=A0A7W3TZK6_9LACO|nr:GNAT family N-acetyltransferase [Limosilactobacillus fastidiosus]MBB1086213.1 GNAT family N-acetyltransferase [Limosilactobacillus fastidiosus]MCD7086515.1 GNAT family N-acetyltransferase [Limosilactobacillus fastidiosus]MCD7114956.1 GNAT family N-acetyltransferase [Limosilactobacillus fastidiosus]MCD7116649.1 GNAT family N-acetyltransferase [Limosilactobacillus fastidiosus]
MQLRKATMTDFETVMEMLRDGRSQLAERGVEQWQGDYPNEEHIKEDIQHGWTYLVQADDNQTVGVFAIVDAPDHSYDELDGKWLLDTDKYQVIHRVAIHSKHAGHGYASQLFENVISYVKTNRKDIKSLRIDTHEDNKVMQHLIDKNGFTRVGTLHGVYRSAEESYVYEMITQPRMDNN